MKHNLKRLTALILALSMCLSLLPATAWAADVSAEENVSADVTAEITEGNTEETDENVRDENVGEEIPAAEETIAVADEEMSETEDEVVEDDAAAETDTETVSEGETVVQAEDDGSATSSEMDSAEESDSSTVTDETDLTLEATYNSGKQDYKLYYASPVNSYLVDTDNGTMRVEYADSRVVVEYYDSDYHVASKKYVEAELSIFGGFYAGEDAYYLVFGQNNYDEDDEVEVIRVVKYSTSWERLSEASLYGANTYVPFKSGSCRMTEYGGYLYIRACHQMYASSDGLHHQANMMIVVQESTMEVTDSQYIVSNTGTGYVSHSFNQFIMVDDEGNLIALDHGDAYPRAAVLFRYTSKAGSSTFSTSNSSVSVLSFNGSTGQNYTGASLGGLEYSSTSYLVAGSSVAQDDNWSSHTARNVFITVTDRNNFSSGGTTVRWITDYDPDGDISASNPHLVKINSDSFLLLWTTVEKVSDDSTIDYCSGQTELHYLFLDGEGNDASEIYTVEGQLSDCAPLVCGNSVIWYVTGDVDDTNEEPTEPVFYSINTDGTYIAQNTGPKTPEITVTPSSNGITVSWETVEGVDGYYIRLGSYFESSSQTVEGNDTNSVTFTGLMPGYTYITWVCAYSGNKKSLAKNKTSIYYMSRPSLTLANTESGIQLSWYTVSGAEEYKIYRKSNEDDYELLATTEDIEWTDTTVADGGTYTYQVYACHGEYCSAGSSAKTLVRLTAPASLEVENGNNGVNVSWSSVDGAKTYRVFYKASSGSSYSYSTITGVSGSTQNCTLSLNSGETYEIYIKALSGSSAGNASKTVTILYLACPEVEIAEQDSGICLNWSAVTGAEEYSIYRKFGNEDYTQLGATDDTSWVDSDITVGATYTYQVFACAGEFISASSSEVVYQRLTDISTCTITLSATSYTYDGTAKKPTVTVKDGSTTLTSGTDYTVSYSNNTNAGTAMVTVTGMGDYTGTVSKTFTISKASQTVSASIASSGILAGETTQITASTTGDGSLSYKSSNTSVATVSSAGLVTGVAAGTATITITAASTTNYNSATKTVSVTVTEAEATDISTCTVTLSTTSYTYNGSAKKPTVTVKDGSTTLTSGTDYTVAYSNNTNAGTATVTITGKGNYTGTATATFTINKASQTVSASIASSSILVGETTQITANTTGAGALSYKSSNTSVATVNSSGLVTGVAAGTATITITAASTTNYNSATKIISIKVTENETAQDISNYSIELWPSDCPYDGLAWEPWVSVCDEDGYYLEEGWDYEVEYKNNVDPGTATVIVTGIGNYTGTLTATFTILLDTPILSSVTNTTSGVKVTWEAVFGATTYRVFRKTGSGSWKKLADTTSTSYTDTTAASGTTYKYTVRCINSACTSYTSSYDTAGLAITRLSAPSLSSASNASSGITVKWAQVKGAQGYRIYRKTGSAASWTKVKTVSGGSTVSWTDTDVTNGTKYTYTVRAYSKASGSTDWSTYNTAGKTNYRLTRPTISSLTNVKTKKMTVKWGKNSKATGYQIQYSTSSSFSSCKTVTVSSYKTVSKTISSLTKGKKYYVRVRAYKTVSGTKYYSAWSSTKNVKISK